MLLAFVVERVCERVRPSRHRAVLEQEAQALGALGLGRVVDGLVVVRVGAVLEQQARRLRVVDDAGGAVERGHRAVLVRVRRVRVGAPLQQLPDEAARREHGLAGVVEGRPAARAARRVRIAAPAASEDERGPRVVGERGQRLEHRLCPPAPSVRRGQHERVGAGLGRCDEPRPAGVALLPRDHELRPREDRLAPVEPRERFRLAGARGADELLRLRPKLIEIHDDLPPRGPCPRCRAEKRSAVWRSGGRGGHCPARGPDAPSRALRCYTRSPAGSSSGTGARVASAEPTRTSAKPATIAAVRCSSRITTPSTAATAGLT